MTRESSEEIQVHVQGRPPLKQVSTDFAGKRRNLQAKQALRRAVREVLGQRYGVGEDRGLPWLPRKDKVYLEIRFYRARSQADSANIIGGIADALQALLYANDRQLSVLIYEEDGDGRHETEYTIKVGRHIKGLISRVYTNY